jgi:enterochelin esterase-like enzyme
MAQQGRVFDNLTMESEILKSSRNYAIYLPPDYDTSERSYPVLYLLHGSGDDHTGWIQFGEVQRIADQAIKAGTCTPMIIAMPDAQTGQLGYFNRGDWRYEDHFFKEFIPYIEKTYRIRSKKRYRAVAGLSMGGGGSFMYALHQPEMFSSSCPLSAYVGEPTFADFKSRLTPEQRLKPEEELLNYYHNHHALSLIDSLPLDKVKSVRWFIDCGDDDFLFEGNSLIHIAMKKKNIPHEYRVREGAHNWTYWRESLPEVLKFISDTFHQK